MLPGHARMRRSEDFRRTVRHGVRAGRRTVVVHALRLDVAASTAAGGEEVRVEQTRADTPSTTGPTDGGQIGFVVSKAVGSAVRRNRVRRRLRHLALAHLPELGDQTMVVVRALPAASTAGPDLGADLDAAWSAALSRLARR